MRRGIRLLAPLFGATATLTLAGAAWGAQGAQAEATGDTTTETPKAATIEGSEVAGSQVEGEASVSTETGIDASGSATTDGLRGTFGIGAIRTLSGLTGINARYFVLDRLSVGFNIGLGTFTFAENDPASTDMCPGPDCRFEDNRTVGSWGMGLEGLYFLKLGNPAGALPFRADFGVGGRFTYFQVINSADVEDNLDDATELDIEIPAVIQLRFGDHFVLSPEFGVNFVIVPGSREDGDFNPGTLKPDTSIAPGDPNGPISGPGFGFQITNGVGLFGGASMHYYF